MGICFSSASTTAYVDDGGVGRRAGVDGVWIFQGDARGRSRSR